MVVSSFFQKRLVVVLSALTVLGLLTYYMTLTKSVVRESIEESKSFHFTPELLQSKEHFNKLRKQRDHVSRHLNLLKKALGQQSCEQLSALQQAGVTVDTRVSVNGGWCSKSSSSNSSDHVWDESFSLALSKFLKGKTVASFGDGPGMYKKHMDSLGEVKIYTAYDGAPFCEEVTGGLVKFLDLTAPQYGLPSYDWVVSVEVGEHIPAEFENIYLSNLARHAKEGIILSWAVPGQYGLSHINNKPLGDVIAQMKRHGFFIDMDAGGPIRQAASASWLKSNVHVYRRIDKNSFEEIDA